MRLVWPSRRYKVQQDEPCCTVRARLNVHMCLHVRVCMPVCMLLAGASGCGRLLQATLDTHIYQI